MKKLMKSALLTLLLATMFTAVQAQRGGGPDKDPADRAEHQTAKMTEKLGLSADQVTKVKAINLKYAEKAKANHDAAKAKNADAREAMRTEHDAELSKVLTKEQAEKWKAMKPDGKGKEMKGHGGGGPDKDPADRAARQTAKMTEQLGLNADQTAKVKAINEQFAEKAKASHEANKGDKAKDKAAHEALRKEHDAALAKVLTKEQAAKWEQQKAERGDKKGKGGAGKHGKGNPRLRPH
jgi:Spy/CpxP family protein refolding chaperone